MHKFVKIIGVTKTKIHVSQWSDICSLFVSHHVRICQLHNQSISFRKNQTIPQLHLPRIEKTMHKSIKTMIFGLFTILREGPAVNLLMTVASHLWWRNGNPLPSNKILVEECFFHQCQRLIQKLTWWLFQNWTCSYKTIFPSQNTFNRTS